MCSAYCFYTYTCLYMYVQYLHPPPNIFMMGLEGCSNHLKFAKKCIKKVAYSTIYRKYNLFFKFLVTLMKNLSSGVIYLLFIFSPSGLRPV